MMNLIEAESRHPDNSKTRTIRVGIIDDEPQIRDALADLVASDSELELVGMACDASEAVRFAKISEPDVILMDVRMPNGDGPSGTAQLRIAAPKIKVVAYSASENRQSVLDMVRAGAVGYVHKGASREEILAAIRCAAAGQVILSPEASTEVVHELAGVLRERERDAREHSEKVQRITDVLAHPERMTILFQPIVDLASGQPVGVEALTRFTGEIERTPDVWFGEAWEVGLGEDLELAAVRRALEHLPQIPDNQYLSINVAPMVLCSAQLNEALVDAPRERLVLEITEHAPFEDYRELNRAIQGIRRSGARVAVDDVGSGHASLSQIVKLDADIIKLDIDITRGIEVDRSSRALAAALVAYGSEVGAELIAEGIETESEVAALRTLGVRLGQGFYLGRPAPLPVR